MFQRNVSPVWGEGGGDTFLRNIGNHLQDHKKFTTMKISNHIYSNMSRFCKGAVGYIMNSAVWFLIHWKYSYFLLIQVGFFPSILHMVVALQVPKCHSNLPLKSSEYLYVTTDYYCNNV